MASSDTYSVLFREVKRIIQKFDGWLSKGEAKYLYSLASYGPGQGAIVEIGSWKGRSTICLARGSVDALGEKAYAQDIQS